MTPDELLRANLVNHRAMFRRTTDAVERFGRVELAYAANGDGALTFPRSARGLGPAVDRIHALGLTNLGVWSARPNAALGEFLLARGFQLGWQPHWMSLALDRLTAEPPAFALTDTTSAATEHLPYGHPGPDPLHVVHLAIVERGETIGHVSVNPWRGVAGIYSMGVAKPARRRGVGRALVLGACRRARELGCHTVTLNATAMGEPVYRRAGFGSQGFGQTWWLIRR